jgi:hypothetical protein
MGGKKRGTDVDRLRDGIMSCVTPDCYDRRTSKTTEVLAASWQSRSVDALHH